MADRKQQYPVRLDISRQGAARAPKATPRDGYSTGSAIRRTAGQAAETSGRMTRLQLAQALPPAIAPLVALTTQEGRIAARDFIDGLVGNPRGGPKVAVAEETAPVTTTEPVAQALAAGRAAQPTITPQDRLLAYVDTLLSGPVTLREAQAAAGLIPAPARPQTSKDKAVGTATSIADATYAADLEKAQALTDQALRDEAIQKATDRYFSRVATVSGANTSNLALQDLIEQ